MQLGLRHADRRELDGGGNPWGKLSPRRHPGQRDWSHTAQLYSTASYQAHDLTDICLAGNYAGLNLASQNLTNANLGNATLTNANLSQANLTNANLPAPR